MLQENSEEKTDELIEPPTPCETDYAANINVVLFSNATMASEFPIGIGKQKNTGLFDSGASHSCISYQCYKETIPHVAISEAAHISVENASGESMDPLGMCEATISLGNKRFTHVFIVCKNLTSSLVLGLDFSSHFRIGTDWTSDGRMYLHQGKKKLIEGTVNAVAAKRPRLVTKIQVNLPPKTIGIVPVQVSQKDFIKPKEIYESVPDLAFECQYPVATLPLLHCNSKERDLIACIVNPTEWTVPIHADKTVQEIRPISAKVKINKLLVTDNKANTLPTKLETFEKEVTLGTVMPGDFSPHQKFNLEDFIVKPETRKKLEHLIAEYDSIVSKDTNDIDTTPLIMMEIETEGPPVASRPYVLSLKHQEFVRKEVAKLAAAGTIRRSLSRYASPVVVVPKKAPPDAPIEDKHRMAIDYRRLNNQMPFVKSVDSHKKGAVSLIPLPKIDQLFARLNGATIFSAIDIRQGYHHIALSEDAIPKTAFSLETGEKWEFLKVPFGLSQAPAYFMALINKVLEGCEEFALGYMDDILIYSPDEETHLIHIETIFNRLQEAKLKLKLSKCSFFKKHVHYLGHLISSDGLLPTVEKTIAIKDLAPPRNVHEVQVVMGMFNYYRKFIPNFAEIAKSIVDLTKKNVNFEWTEKCQLAFDTLKTCLVEGPILVYPDPNKDYHLFTDASKDTWSAVLMQDQSTVSSDCLDLRPIAYQSGTFKGSQLNWATLTKEAYAIYMAFRKFSFYLEGALTNLRCDHAPLEKFLQGKTLNNKVNNWGIELSNFKINFQHIKGKRNVMADALSRVKRLGLYDTQDPEPNGQEFGHTILEDLPPIKVSQIVTNERPVKLLDCENERMMKHQNDDETCQHIKHNLGLPKFNSYKLEDGVLYRVTKIKDQLFDAILVPGKLQNQILIAVHENLGHMGTNKTYSFLRQRYFWPGMKKQLAHHIQTCGQCAQENLRAPPYVPGTLTVPSQPMYHLYMDLIGQFPTTENGNNYCLTACCAFTDYLFCIPIPNKEAETVVQAYLKHIYAHFGGSKVLITDNGTEFKNSLFKEVCDELQLTQHHITAYLPSSNLVERHHSSLKRCISKFCQKDASRWDEIVPYACLAQNLFPHSLEGESAMFKMFGRDPIVLGMETMFQPKRRYLGNKITFIDLEQLHSFHMRVAVRLHEARKKSDKQYSGKNTLPKIGDAVLFRNHSKTGFSPNFLPGYRVVKIINDANYVIKHMTTG